MTPGMQLPDGLALYEREGARVLRAHTPACTLEVSLSGAHVTSWIPEGHSESMWLSPLATFTPGSHIRGGVPIIGPWFGRGISGNEEPQHGWFRRAKWDLASVHVDLSGVVDASFTLAERSNHPGFEVGAASLHVRAGTSLELSLTVSAGKNPFELEVAFHTYFLVDDVREAHLEGLAGVPFTDAARGRAAGVGTTTQTFTAPTDLVFEAAPPLVLADPGAKRRIVIEQSGASRTVVWTPWKEGVAATSDIPISEWMRFVCVETAVSEGGAVTLNPGEEHTLTARYALRHG
ncbi:D-hexose-6-phosphate mutarotase [Dermabacter sp. p3-SID358]|uniref:D-hexose-6-phosphate mutarotase n=1 Tax=Dermabacter sp. p3-SID358 TaxID=2916114 RepID=UPI0021A37274|nr:D-hexose-6-phosphate mutarotase [Dermabacter sp. p3-SID358]MCT1866173.1 D-hexose-6-phosphate mutarotase [Dermabacter sp. p3-SID358]